MDFPPQHQTTGSLYASIREEMKQLNYLHQLLNKDKDNWARKSLLLLDNLKSGWAKSIRDTLHTWDLEQDWTKIEKKAKSEWKKEVENAAEKINTGRLRDECYTKERTKSKIKSKSKSIIDEIDDPLYRRKPLEIMRHGFVIVTRALIMGRFGMLQCKANYSYGSKNKNCDTCKVLDDKNHRINECILYKDINLYNSDTKINFESMHSKTIVYFYERN